MTITVTVTKEALMRIAEQRIDRILMANHDYGDAWQTNGPFTPLMRIKEKLIRVETLSDGRPALVQEEKVETNVAEVFDYSLLWMLWAEENKWLAGSSAQLSFQGMDMGKPEGDEAVTKVISYNPDGSIKSITDVNDLMMFDE